MLYCPFLHSISMCFSTVDCRLHLIYPPSLDRQTNQYSTPPSPSKLLNAKALVSNIPQYQFSSHSHIRSPMAMIQSYPAPTKCTSFYCWVLLFKQSCVGICTYYGTSGKCNVWVIGGRRPVDAAINTMMNATRMLLRWHGVARRVMEIANDAWKMRQANLRI